MSPDTTIRIDWDGNSPGEREGGLCRCVITLWPEAEIPGRTSITWGEPEASRVPVNNESAALEFVQRSKHEKENEKGGFGRDGGQLSSSLEVRFGYPEFESTFTAGTPWG